ncbi:O-antigen ligase family protein [Obesumbacterium proteus]|uniref:O-antigen ligase family protein n=2 Tax=Obesumbacterium proteus TaxID=82983 RepID=UPI001F30D3C4|nr:O-antigen ligase family protein [Obesumbacterium proteus]MCE9887098.1 O-antigen ligase family protein [Obesumbacterium proteus]MCE9916958.1 O-antigen ligase family protein [Obesumbacterium proteus]
MSGLLFKYARISYLIILFLSITIPTALQPLKMGLLALCLGFALMSYIGNNSIAKISKGILISCLIFSIIGVMWSLYGLFRVNPGAINVITVYGIYPLLALVLLPLYREGDIYKLRSFFIFCCVTIAAIQILFILSGIGLDGGFIFSIFKYMYGEVAVVNNGEGKYLLFTLPNVASLLFLIPFLCTDFLAKKTVAKAALIIILCSLMLLTGRRALFVVVAMGGVLAVYFLGKIIPFYRRKVLAIAIISMPIICIILYAAVDFNSMSTQLFIEQVTSILNFKTDDSNLERVYQFEALIDGVINSPIVGAGGGAAASYLRSETQPWTYELYYIALMFQYGLVVFSAYVAGVIYIAVRLYKFILLKNLGRHINISIASYLVGYLCFIIASATNPYLAKFDYVWVIFIPTAIINYYICNKKI